MTIQTIKDQLNSSERPIAKSFHTGEHFKVLLFGFKKGMKLDDHTAHHPTKLLVLEGEVIYHQSKKDVRMKQFDEIDIPAEMEHSVAALEDSLVLLTQG
ncbi:cupin domain-containing protein [Gracilimonas halophila]|uniref:Cupin domain-containing protein n=1 Tax=Gracilimonas halophila TaxID=1834464 RepID=A0ABW5JKD3_9BACT